jgi:hypothetical protein
MITASSRAAWRTSSHSGANGDCIQVAATRPELVAVRDSKDPTGSALAFTAAQWTSFIRALKGHARS